MCQKIISFCEKNRNKRLENYDKIESMRSKIDEEIYEIADN